VEGSGYLVYHPDSFTCCVLGGIELTKEELEPACRWEWNTRLSNTYETFEKYLNAVYLWAIENPTAAEDVVRTFNQRSTST